MYKICKGATMSNENFVTIPVEEYQDLLDTQLWAACLCGAGVDNWEGYDYAMEEYQEAKGNE